jgi:single-strand DNA-binding protein
MNTIFIIGNVGKDPEARALTGGNAVAEFPLADTKKGYTSKDGKEIPSTTEWFNIKTFGSNTSFVEKYVKKGDKLHIQGSIRTEQWEKDGQKQYKTFVIADKIEILAHPNQTTQQQPTPHSAFPQHQPMGAPQYNDGLPF